MIKTQIIYPRQIFRQELALKILKKYTKNCKNFLEIGAGLGNFSKELYKKLPNGDIIESSEDSIKILKENLKDTSVKIISGDFSKYNFEKKYSLIILFEVLEHIKDDEKFLNKIHNLLDDQGVLIFSVPSRMKKWSLSDKIAGHYRRYEKKEVSKKLENENFKIKELISYGFPIINLSSLIRDKLINKNKTKSLNLENKNDMTNLIGQGLFKYIKYKNFFIFLSKILFSKKLTKFYIIITSIFNKYDLGDGYICLAKKR